MFLKIPHRANDSFISFYITELGGNKSQIRIAWFVAVTSEAVIFATSHFWFKRFNEIVSILIAEILYSLRWLVLAYVGGTNSSHFDASTSRRYFWRLLRICFSLCDEVGSGKFAGDWSFTVYLSIFWIVWYIRFIGWRYDF